MDFIVNGILCETRPGRTKEEKLREIMTFLDLKYSAQGSSEAWPGPEDARIILGNSVRSVRERIKHTQDELAMILGIRQAEVSYIENGCRMITTQEILKLFDYVPDINKEIFFGGKSRFTRPTDQKYIYACSLLNSYGFDCLSDQLDLLIGQLRYHI
ncbi:MAG: helix-turn-helix domain-containing protein [Lachnospiraceae bacterium]|nr:helix-turn-helix domain-containing protein [Lachnospiraceae bacterium]